jgi:hypothetical protein
MRVGSGRTVKQPDYVCGVNYPHIEILVIVPEDTVSDRGGDHYYRAVGGTSYGDSSRSVNEGLDTFRMDLHSHFGNLQQLA